MKEVRDILTSKKFLLTVLTVATFLLNGQYDLATATILTYLGVQGAIDHKNAGF